MAPSVFDSLAAELLAPQGLLHPGQPPQRSALEILAQMAAAEGCTPQIATQVMVHGFKWWKQPPASKLFVQLLFHIFSKDKVERRLGETPRVAEDCIRFLLTAFAADNAAAGGPEPVDVLRTMGTMLFENGAACQKLHSTLLATLLPLTSPAVSIDADIRRMAINCLGNVCVGTGTKSPQLQKDAFAALLSNLDGDISDEGVSKVLSSAFRGLQLLINENKSLAVDSVAVLVNHLQRCALTHPDSSAKRGPASPARDTRPSPRKGTLFTSDSELSEGELKGSKFRYISPSGR
ncbi:hypothetical protein BDK51DRAFT_26050 [Blyttiomyces helicus]|uniref:Armadillo-type protein n=1 Tax=Blyttiomyces helicus TaxID=388810 RepID=A0A4P9W5U6_9FUNG|nr:hypothetical protein BDK51DRAFT_26050 [Blyttiomyces helicus]|eukprot:RKO87799.1 hypothetical protein BDK51DRAFT_26050 [Blyttiomyces helicus]